MNGCIYRTRSDLCMKFTTDQSISFCIGKKCPDRKESNADRIRSMTDEELAKSITDDLCDRVCHSPLSCDGNCETQVLAWLKQEAVDNGACSADETSEKVQEDE